jgi:hypothetical protein
VILSRTVPSLSATETTSTNLNVSAEPTPEEVEQLRKALYDSLTSYAAQQATPGTVENIPDKPDTMSDMSADIRDMTRLRDTPAPDASGLIHFTDPDAIKAWDAEQRAAATSPVPKSSNGRLARGGSMRTPFPVSYWPRQGRAVNDTHPRRPSRFYPSHYRRLVCLFFLARH